MFCTHCGVENKDDAQFCKTCGKPMGMVVNAPVAGTASASTPPTVTPSPVTTINGELTIAGQQMASIGDRVSF